MGRSFNSCVQNLIRPLGRWPLRSSISGGGAVARCGVVVHLAPSTGEASWYSTHDPHAPLDAHRCTKSRSHILLAGCRDDVDVGLGGARYGRRARGAACGARAPPSSPPRGPAPGRGRGRRAASAPVVACAAASRAGEAEGIVAHRASGGRGRGRSGCDPARGPRRWRRRVAPPTGSRPTRGTTRRRRRWDVGAQDRGPIPGLQAATARRMPGRRYRARAGRPTTGRARRARGSSTGGVMQRVTGAPAARRRGGRCRRRRVAALHVGYVPVDGVGRARGRGGSARRGLGRRRVTAPPAPAARASPIRRRRGAQ